MTGSRRLIYDSADKNRIDKYLKDIIFPVSVVTRATIAEAIRAGRVLVNGKKVKPSYYLKKCDQIEYGNVIAEEYFLESNSVLKIPLMFENADFAVFNKPHGVQVHPDAKNQNDTLANFLVAVYPEIRNVHDQSKEAQLRPGIVHRLDKDTSGVIVVAKNEKTFIELKRLFGNREMTKQYLALVYGNPLANEGMIDKPLARSGNYRKQVVAGKKTKTKIRPAVTNYRVTERFGEKYALLEVSPKTGRMHQIRVHLASIGHPIVGDKKYCLKNIQPNLAVGRQLLHAASLEFSLFGHNYAFSAELPDDFRLFMESQK